MKISSLLWTCASFAIGAKCYSIFDREITENEKQAALRGVDVLIKNVRKGLKIIEMDPKNGLVKINAAEPEIFTYAKDLNEQETAEENELFVDQCSQAITRLDAVRPSIVDGSIPFDELLFFVEVDYKNALLNFKYNLIMEAAIELFKEIKTHLSDNPEEVQSRMSSPEVEAIVQAFGLHFEDVDLNENLEAFLDKSVTRLQEFSSNIDELSSLQIVPVIALEDPLKLTEASKTFSTPEYLSTLSWAFTNFQYPESRVGDLLVKLEIVSQELKKIESYLKRCPDGNLVTFFENSPAALLLTLKYPTALRPISSIQIMDLNLAKAKALKTEVEAVVSKGLELCELLTSEMKKQRFFTLSDLDEFIKFKNLVLGLKFN